MLSRQCDLSNKFEFYIVPNANPDGYQFSITDDRYWRKNRRKNPDPLCYGVDLNRNWDYKWGVGASVNLCSEVYRGTSPFSEPETKALKTEMEKVKNMVLMIAFHNYGQSLLHPWGWTTTPAPDYDAMKDLGNVFVSAASSDKRKYSVSNSAGSLYFASGATDDWAKGILNAKYSYTLELPPKYGFTVPAKDIIPISEEIIAGFKAILKAIVDE